MALLVSGSLGACNTLAPGATGSLAGGKSVLLVSDEERDCLGRAMYFEAKRSDEEGLLAVGTVVMNRVEAKSGPHSICAVVGQPGQFAAGVLTKPLQETSHLQTVADVADALLAGERHEKVGGALHFHTAGLRFPYPNMHYVAVVGGNAFYEKRRPEGSRPSEGSRQALAAKAPRQPPAGALAFAPEPGRLTQ